MSPDWLVDGRLIIPSGMWIHLARLLGLSSREVQIVKLIFDDRKLVSIAFELGISPKTVGTYIQRLYTKLHVSSRTQLILRVVGEYLCLLASGDATNEMSCAAATGEDPT